MQVAEIAWMVRIAPWVPVVLGAFWLVVTQVGVFWLRGKLSDQDVAARLAQLMERETLALNRAQEMFAGEHYDLAVIESWKAVETRLQRGVLPHDDRQDQRSECQQQPQRRCQPESAEPVRQQPPGHQQECPEEPGVDLCPTGERQRKHDTGR